jgi:Short C-terminal domain
MPGLLRGVARVAVASGTATAVSNRVSRRQANKWADQGDTYYPQSRMAPPPQQAPQMAPPPQQAPQMAPPPVAQPSTIDQLKELAELKQQGILTDEEFAAQKAKVLAG